MCAEVLSADGLEIIGVMKSVKLSGVGHSERNAADHAPDTWVELGPADWSVLMAIPHGVRHMGPALVGGSRDTTTSQERTPMESGGSGPVTTAPQVPAAGGGDPYEAGMTIGPRRDAPANAPQQAATSGRYTGAPRPYAGGDHAPGAYAGKNYAPGAYSGKDYAPRSYTGRDYSQPGAPRAAAEKAEETSTTQAQKMQQQALDARNKLYPKGEPTDE
jgi:hypothetical protein